MCFWLLRHRLGGKGGAAAAVCLPPQSLTNVVSNWTSSGSHSSSFHIPFPPPWLTMSMLTFQDRKELWNLFILNFFPRTDVCFVLYCKLRLKNIFNKKKILQICALHRLNNYSSLSPSPRLWIHFSMYLKTSRSGVCIIAFLCRRLPQQVQIETCFFVSSEDLKLDQNLLKFWFCF